ncbi:chromate transporter [Kurthia gibsonii]|uniref:chromate transporter n=1 Tax=Kurthia gibsonii TaxID=33946 RepID=UPI000EB510F1|nr:chromate transporter [Kurthia gibsonii]RXH51327.1 chromate transporter [Kurthia gibsonii]
MRQQKAIFISFFRSGVLGFGGGPSVIPLIEREVVKNFKLMDSDEFANTLAIANTLPGPIATKMAGYVGYRVAGFTGMLNALVAAVIPTVVAVILLLGSLQKFQEVPFVQGMTKGVILVVSAMMFSLMVDFLKKSYYKLGILTGLVLLAISIILMVILNLHPGIVIVSFLVLAFVLPVRKGGKST